MKYTVELDSCVMIYIPSCIKIGSDIEKLTWEDTQKHRHHGGHLLWESRLKKMLETLRNYI
jgi:hypothetical protein